MENLEIYSRNTTDRGNKERIGIFYFCLRQGPVLFSNVVTNSRLRECRRDTRLKRKRNYMRRRALYRNQM